MLCVSTVGQTSIPNTFSKGEHHHPFFDHMDDHMDVFFHGDDNKDDVNSYMD